MTVLLTDTRTDAAELERLAEAYLNDELPTWEVYQAVDRIAHPNLTPTQVWALFEDLVDAINDRQRLADGHTDWQAIDPTLTGPGRADTAADICDERATHAITTLTGSAR